WATLRHLPIGFTIDPYFDARGHPALPIAKGLVSWVRKVDAHGCIEFNGAEYFIRRKLERQYVVATLSTYRRRVFIKYEGKRRPRRGTTSVSKPRRRSGPGTRSIKLHKSV
ncbi:MAG: hypothetical protein NT009_10315, partial [Proteobacteria bacterium]|nr:hypothetical protein [Pseudomonadota bacterium]